MVISMQQGLKVLVIKTVSTTCSEMLSNGCRDISDIMNVINSFCHSLKKVAVISNMKGEPKTSSACHLVASTALKTALFTTIPILVYFNLLTGFILLLEMMLVLP